MGNSLFLFEEEEKDEISLVSTLKQYGHKEILKYVLKHGAMDDDNEYSYSEEEDESSYSYEEDE